ncbi:MAG: LysE family translocator [Deltaproteobacteria bacterium]|nr:MAG: LysE family translocator [Deltaproteobacteria bacterium]
MIDGTDLLIFSLATLLVVIAPGPGMLYVISRGIAGGRKAGIISALGTSTGIAAHILAAAFGLSLIIYATEIGFRITKWAGGVYLLFLAWKTFTHRQGLTSNTGKVHGSHTSIFWQGLLVNALNPKVALFFLAFIPQFVNPESDSVPAQTIALGTIFMILTVIVFAAYGISAAMIRKWLIEQPRIHKVIDWAMGSLFVFLGIRLVLSGHR